LSARRAWETEAKNLRELSERDHPHLIRRIATVIHGKQFIILSDWANGGDLKNFWEQEPKPPLGPKLVSEVVAQLSGLASAIELMHNGNYMGTVSHGVSRSSSTHASSTPVIIAVNGEAGRVVDTAAEDANWRHGDLKPENILRFRKVGELVGNLRISDLGLAKRHVKSTDRRIAPTMSQFGTLDYEPPEAMTMLSSPRSRLYDIWSFGCIMLEFVVWLLYGYEGLEAFWKLPTEKDGTLFWSRLPVSEGPGAMVNSSVAQIMDGILSTNPACRSPSAIRDLLLLVKDKVLVPALPDVQHPNLPGHRRIRAGVLLKELEEIKSKCGSSQYCCPGQLERNARLPTDVLHPIPRNISDTLHIPATQHGNGAGRLQVPPSHQVPSSLQVPPSFQVPPGAVRAQRVMHIG
jgi:serine/threonine protein kinase